MGRRRGSGPVSAVRPAQLPGPNLCAGGRGDGPWRQPGPRRQREAALRPATFTAGARSGTIERQQVWSGVARALEAQLEAHRDLLNTDVRLRLPGPSLEPSPMPFWKVAEVLLGAGPGLQTRLGRRPTCVWSRATPQQRQLCARAGVPWHDQYSAETSSWERTESGSRPSTVRGWCRDGRVTPPRRLQGE